MSSEIPQITNLFSQVASAYATSTNEYYQYLRTTEVYQKNFNILITEINKLRTEIETLKTNNNLR